MPARPEDRVGDDLARSSGMVVCTPGPAIRNSASARSIRSSASSRSGAQQTTFASSESYCGGTFQPARPWVSTRTNGPPGGTNSARVPGAGAKSRAGSSALTRHSTATPRGTRSSWDIRSASPEATRICSATRSTPYTASVTGCSTWMRQFISMNEKPSSCTRNSKVPAPV